MAEFEPWLRSIGLDGQIETFRANRIDFDVLGELSEADLVGLGVPLGDRIRLKRAFAELRGSSPQAQLEASAKGAGVGAERRRLTVLFCDLVGSTDLAMRLDPEALGNVIRAFLDAVSRTMLRCGGHVSRLLGDGVVVYFGWPRADEEQVERSVAAGLEVIKEVAGLQVDSDLRLSCRVGIATGDVVVGDVAGESEPWNTVVGTTPNLAARLQAAAQPGQLLVDAETWSEVSANFRAESLPAREFKGFPMAVPAWHVLERLPRETRFEARRSRAQPLIGRESELALLLDRWRRAASGTGQVVLLCGESGIGKSKLLEAMASSIAPAAAFNHIRYQCAPLQSDTPLYPIIQQMNRAFCFTQQDSDADRRAKLDAALQPVFADKPDVIERFASLFSLPVNEAAAPRREPPPLQRERILQALVELPLRLANRRPILAAFEDAQWADPTTERVLHSVMAALVQAPILLVITSREPFTPSWFVGSHVSTINLVKLDRRESASLVRATAAQALEEPMVERIAERADGIPLFVEEMTKAVVESRSAVAHDGDRPDRAKGSDPLPTTLQASLNSRLDHLESAKWVAQTGAVIGREFSIRLLARVLEHEPAELEPDLERLTGSGLVVPRGSGEAATLWYKHALVHEAAYRTLLGIDRKRLHSRVLDCYEELFPQQLEQAAESLARHAAESERWDKAAEYLSMAYANAARRAANREAINIFNRAVEALAKLPEDAVATRAIDLRLHAFTAFHIVGANDKLIELIREAERLAERIGDRRRLAAAGVQTAFALWLDGKHVEAQARAEKVLTIAKMPKDFPIVISALFNLANIHHAQGQVAEAVGLHRRMLGMLRGELAGKRFGWSAPPAVIAGAFCAWYLVDLGEFGEAAAVLEEVEPLATAAEPHGRVMVDTARGILTMHTGDFARAVEIFRPALSLSQRGEVLTMLPMVAACLGRALCGTGQVGEALSVLTDAVARETYRFGGKYTWIHLRLALAEAYRLSGQLARAGSEAELARQIADDCGEVVHQAYAVLEEGHIALARDDANAALASAETALAVARSRGLRPFATECLMLAASAQTRLNRHQDATASRAEAGALKRGMGLAEGASATPPSVRSA